MSGETRDQAHSGAGGAQAGARLAYPFTAIVGQEEIKRSLILTAVDASIGGVLVLGDRGVGKSTAVRALAALLPPIEAVEGCPYQCAALACAAVSGCPHSAESPPKRLVARPTPVVDLPLGATEDRVAGALDVERALTLGEKRFEPGLLAKAHRGYLYIDEVNLLEDHLVDLLLDAAASGENVVEREGLSIRHDARFVLVGSGNPEEGELRPQLLDRFGLSVEAVSPSDLEERVSVVRRRDAFDRDPAAFCDDWAAAETALRERILAGRGRLQHVAAPDAAIEDCARLCLELGADGLRGELTLLRAARALAAYEGAAAVGRAEIRAVAPSALRHRLRRDPLDEAGSTARVRRALERCFGPEEGAGAQTAAPGANAMPQRAAAG
ncbi:MAG: magnesium chelatase ATPase subunit I [Pseudomonadota bacterium]